MVSDLVSYQLVFVVLLGLFVLLHYAWLRDRAVPSQRPSPLRQRSRAPKPFAGLTHKPHCEACARDVEPRQQAPSAPPPRMVPRRGRRPQVDTALHFCPHANCSYQGWVGWGNIRANGHPSGKRWRQLYCLGCRGYFQETHGTPLHGKHVEPDQLVWAVAALAEGLGIRAVARVFAVDPNTVLGWLVETADHLQAFSRSFLHDVPVDQVQLDELFALLSAVKDGELSEADAMKSLSRSPHWVWVAIDPESKLILTVDVGERTLAMAQCVVHQLVHVLVPNCVPLFLTDGHKDYFTAILTYFGYWLQPPRCQGKGPTPKRRWRPLPQLLYGQVIKTVRRRRLVRVSHRVVFGTLEAINQVLAKRGWQMNTAFVERINLDIRQHVAAVGRRVNTLCKQEAGVRQQLVLYQVYHNFVLPHASLRQPLPQPLSTNGTGSAKTWRPRTPAMAAGLTAHVWTLREVLLFRVPPWPQPAGL